MSAPPKPSSSPRPGGGFNQGFDDFGEHMDEKAMMSAMSQKATAQQQADPAGSSAAATGAAAKQQAMGGHQQAPAPRDVAGVAEELVTRPATDMSDELKQFFSVNTWLGMAPPNPDSPEDTAKKKQVHQRFQNLTQEQQQVAKKNYQMEIEKKKLAEEEKERKKQQEEAKKQQELVMPSSPQKGPIGPAGSSKQRAVAKLQQDRTTLGGPGSAN